MYFSKNVYANSSFKRSLKIFVFSFLSIFSSVGNIFGTAQFILEDDWNKEPGFLEKFFNPKEDLLPSSKEIEELFKHNKSILQNIKERSFGPQAEIEKNKIHDDLNALEGLNKALSLRNMGFHMFSLNTYKSIAKEYPLSIVAPEAYFQAGRLYSERNQFSSAFSCFDTIIKKYPAYPLFERTIGEQFEVANKLLQGKRPYYWGLIPGFKNRESAVKYFESVVSNAPFSEYAPRALMLIAEFSLANKEQEIAINALDRLINKYPFDKNVPDAYLLMGDIYLSLVFGPSNDQGATCKAIDYYKDFIELFSDSRTDLLEKAKNSLKKAKNLYAENKLILGNFFYSRRNNPQAALVFYNEAIEIDPTSEIAFKANDNIEKIQKGILPKKLWIDYILGRYKSKKS